MGTADDRIPPSPDITVPATIGIDKPSPDGAVTVELRAEFDVNQPRHCPQPSGVDTIVDLMPGFLA